VVPVAKTRRKKQLSGIRKITHRIYDVSSAIYEEGVTNGTLWVWENIYAIDHFC
jgi:hypothetical protein